MGAAATAATAATTAAIAVILRWLYFFSSFMFWLVSLTASAVSTKADAQLVARDGRRMKRESAQCLSVLDTCQASSTGDSCFRWVG